MRPSGGPIDLAYIGAYTTSSLALLVLGCYSTHISNLLAGKTLMKFRPLGDRVVVRRIKEDQKTAGGIIIPDTVQEKPQEGEVISIGPGAIDEKTGKRTPLEVKAGDYVLFGKWSGTEVKLDGEELLIMKESDIMGVIEGAPAVAKAA